MEHLQFGFFEYAYIGIPITVAGILYMMFIGKYFLPDDLAQEVAEVEQEFDDPLLARKNKLSAVLS